MLICRNDGSINNSSGTKESRPLMAGHRHNGSFGNAVGVQRGSSLGYGQAVLTPKGGWSRRALPCSTLPPKPLLHPFDFSTCRSSLTSTTSVSTLPPVLTYPSLRHMWVGSAQYYRMSDLGGYGTGFEGWGWRSELWEGKMFHSTSMTVQVNELLYSPVIQFLGILTIR